MSKKYRSDAMAAIHETMEALHDVGAIDKQTMRRFDWSHWPDVLLDYKCFSARARFTPSGSWAITARYARAGWSG